MYDALRAAAIRILKLPEGPPNPPPGGAVVKTFNASRKYLSYRLLGIWIGCAALYLVAVALGVGAVFEGAVLAALAFAIGLAATLVLVAGYVSNRLEYELRYYIVTDRSLRIREGVFFLRESTLTFANVQNLRTRQGPIQRLFGISDVLVDTAGGAGGGKDDDGHALQKGHRGTIQGIENPAEIRDLVMALLRKYRDAGLGDPDDPSHSPKAREEDAERLREILVEVKALRKSMSAI